MIKKEGAGENWLMYMKNGNS